MVKIKFIVFLLLVSMQSVNLLAQITPIIDLRENNSDGIPVHMGESFTVSGIVTTSTEYGSSGPASLQDNTAGISVYGSGFAGAVSIGDSVTLTSSVTHYNGLTQFDFSSGSTVTVLKSGLEVEPKTVTLNQILSQSWNAFEELEGTLVRVNAVAISGNGAFEGGTNYSISDSTGTLEIRIDNDVSSIIGSSIPSSNIDIVGVIGQYDRDIPLSSGYQLLPRSINDIVTDNEPLIISPVIAADITTSSYTVYFSTVREGSSQINFGKTESLELGSVIIPEERVTNHKVVVSSLKPTTTYYYRAISSNDNGTSESQLYNVSTASDDTTIGAVNIYFNGSVDHSVAIPGNEAMGSVDFKTKIIERINSSTHSIDLALYSFFGLNDVANAIISAKNNRGVKVRVVYTNRDMQSSMQLLKNAGILISQRPTTSGLMHNKFAIFDGRDDNPQNDWIWTGSWNWTSLNNKNNVVEINSPTLASAYTKEFEEMWGSDNDTPNSSIAKFGSVKLDNTTHSFNIGGRQVELFFSPSDATESQITNILETADSSIFFGMLAFTSDPIFSKINSRFNSGVTDIRGIISDANIDGSEFSNLQSISEVFDYNLGGTFHHKYGMVDAYSASLDPVVITGSHNWSRSANEKNDENTLIIHDVYIANQYMQEFKSSYNQLGGNNSFSIPT
ncbi:MAG: hypothetical protein GY936_08790, partial [Ignavibacteriae bacterium]|nr:hypothetical protein [Ignavibacteriota bacterium]